MGNAGLMAYTFRTRTLSVSRLRVERLLKFSALRVGVGHLRAGRLCFDYFSVRLSYRSSSLSLVQGVLVRRLRLCALLGGLNLWMRIRGLGTRLYAIGLRSCSLRTLGSLVWTWRPRITLWCRHLYFLHLLTSSRILLTRSVRFGTLRTGAYRPGLLRARILLP